MCIQWIRVLYSVVIKRQSNPPTCAFQNSAERVMNSRVAVQCVQVTLSIYTIHFNNHRHKYDFKKNTATDSNNKDFY